MATGARHTTFSILGSDVVVTGNVAASVDLHVDGKIDGDLKCANLVQGEASEIKGSVVAETAKIARERYWIPFTVFAGVVIAVVGIIAKLLE